MTTLVPYSEPPIPRLAPVRMMVLRSSMDPVALVGIGTPSLAAYVVHPPARRDTTA